MIREIEARKFCMLIVIYFLVVLRDLKTKILLDLKQFYHTENGKIAVDLCFFMDSHDFWGEGREGGDEELGN